MTLPFAPRSRIGTTTQTASRRSRNWPSTRSSSECASSPARSIQCNLRLSSSRCSFTFFPLCDLLFLRSSSAFLRLQRDRISLIFLFPTRSWTEPSLPFYFLFLCLSLSKSIPSDSTPSAEYDYCIAIRFKPSSSPSPVAVAIADEPSRPESKTITFDSQCDRRCSFDGRVSSDRGSGNAESVVDLVIASSSRSRYVRRRIPILDFFTRFEHSTFGNE